MDELNERDLFRVRFRFLDLIKSFFALEPDAERMSRWRGTFSALAKEQVSPRFDNAVKEMSRALNDKTLKELKEEYYKLFVNPFDGTMVETTASYYLNGRSYDQALVDLRSLMNEAGLQKDQAVTDPEDSLVVMLDTFTSLVEEEKVGGGDKSRELQGKMLEEFLEPFTEKFTATLKENEHADFYYLCCRILGGYLDLEKSLVP
ncbi:MAG: molecular chaperone TorD family protein [Desulfobulbaceae bacterium]|nr:molecular chaperone TorD family protein [Desulfobulbaceae bacterium]